MREKRRRPDCGKLGLLAPRPWTVIYGSAPGRVNGSGAPLEQIQPGCAAPSAATVDMLPGILPPARHNTPARLLTAFWINRKPSIRINRPPAVTHARTARHSTGAAGRQCYAGAARTRRRRTAATQREPRRRPPGAVRIPTDQRQGAEILIESAALDWPIGGRKRSFKLISLG